MLEHRGRLLISCPDRPGIVSAVAKLLFEQGANLVDSDQHTTDPDAGLFFMRIEFDLPQLATALAKLEQAFHPIAQRFEMTWRIELAQKAKRVAIFVSKQDHCLRELLWAHQAGDLRCQVAMVVSNHLDLAPVVQAHGLTFHHVPVTSDTKAQAEEKQLGLLEGRADLVVLARYMQVLSPAFVQRYPNQIINIHHSFLPAFVGANPYQQAYERGVKLIGATAHYVTSELDAGPIIEQDVQRVGHRDDAADLKRIGRHVERIVLARAVAWHVEDRILVHGNKTVVFS